MAVLAIDYGAKKVGLAKSDQAEVFALPLLVLENKGKADLLAQLKTICHQHDITKIVVGVPLSFSKAPKNELLRRQDLSNKQLQEVLAFVEWLKISIGYQVVVEDERLSTKMANTLKRGMMKNGSDDDVAAMLILQSYLDRKK